MKVYLVCEGVDLGSKVLLVYASKSTADKECLQLKEMYRKASYSAFRDLGYNEERTKDLLEYYTQQMYFVEEHEVLNDI